jgi:hypothetical protein
VPEEEAVSHPIIMNWTNETGDTLAFGNVKVQNGTTPVASPPSMTANGASSVSADQSHNLTAGPVGSYSWTNAANANQSVGTQYNHPSGSGKTSVTVSCSSAYQVSDDNATWVQAQTYTNSSLQQHTAQIGLFIRPAGSNPPPPPPPPPPPDKLVPLLPDMSNKAAFVNSLFTNAVRDPADNNLDPMIAAGSLLYPYADPTSQGYILNGWLAAWQMYAGDPYNQADYQRCPVQDGYFIQWLVEYIEANDLYLSAPALTLQPGGASPPVYVCTGYGRSQFYNPSTKTWNYGSYWSNPGARNQTVSQFLYLLYFGAHTVVISSSANLDGGNAVQNFHDALQKSGLPTRKDLYNSHYGVSGGATGIYYAPQGAPTPSVANRDVESLATSSPPGKEPLNISLVTGQTASSDPNSFLQLEGWPSQDVLLPKPGGARHNADYQANESLYWNFSTYGASVYSEKRSTPIFLANANFNLAINPATGMPTYTGAATLQDWMNPNLIVNT